MYPQNAGPDWVCNDILHMAGLVLQTLHAELHMGAL